jgi:membrane-bound lytic murein transglycosylase D
MESYLRQRWTRRLVVVFLPVAAACGPKVQTLNVAPIGLAPNPAVGADATRALPDSDPVLALLEASNAHFRAGELQLQQGHLDAAKLEFDLALDVLIRSPYGARTEGRIREQFDRLVDRISASEVRALGDGDGFTEKGYEAASIDRLLAETTTFDPPPAPPELKQTVEAHLRAVAHDVPIPLDPRVLAYIELFQGRLHDFIQEGMERGGKYLPMIQEVFRAEGLPLDLAYIPLIESAFKPNALSRARAKGVWQFMARTATEHGLKQDWYIDERSDPEKATLAAARYLRTLHNMFDGDWHLALASYNGGPGRVQRALRRGGVDDFWQLAAKRNLLPRETRDYVPMILAAIVVARNPMTFGFDFDPEPTQTYETVLLPGPVDLRRVAEWAETDIDEIQALNPELRRWTTPVNGEAYELKVPEGVAARVNERLTEAIGAELATLNWHTVKRGETLSGIARKLRVSRNDLAAANYLRTNARLSAGQKLIVPLETTVLMAARVATPAAQSAGADGPDVLPAARVDGDAPPTEAARVKVTYSVKRGDTLIRIARLFKTTVAAIQAWNPSIYGDRIRAGQRLTLYRPAS